MSKERVVAPALAPGAGAALEPDTGVPAEVFDRLPVAAQAALIARIAPERVVLMEPEAAEAVLVVVQRAVAALSAVQDLAIVACVRAEEAQRGQDRAGGAGSVGHARGSFAPPAEVVVASSLAPLLHLSPRSVGPRVERAVRVVRDMPCTLAAALSGDLEPSRVAVVADQAGLLEPGAVAMFDRAVHADPAVTSMVPGRLRRTCERIAAQVDAGAFERRAEAARPSRFVRVQPGLEPGMSWWTASLDAVDSARAWAAVEALAAEYVGADPARTITQARADAFVDLVLAQASVTATVELVLPVDTTAQASGTGSGTASGTAFPSAEEELTAADETLGQVLTAELAASANDVAAGLLDQGMSELAGLPSYAAAKAVAALEAAAAASAGARLASRILARYGIELPRWRPPPVGVRDPRAGWILSTSLVGILTDPDVRLRLSRADVLTGVSVARDPRTYRPNAALAARVRDRDRTCRFPGCAAPARRCDLDHVVAFPAGLTREDNLVCLCRTHHGFKHHARWQLVLLADGSCVWRAPTGRTHTTRPEDLRLDAA